MKYLILTVMLVLISSCSSQQGSYYQSSGSSVSGSINTILTLLSLSTQDQDLAIP